jgi:hypothetical protein
MIERRNATAGFGDLVRIDVCDDDTGGIARFGDNVAPGVDDHAVAEGVAAVLVLAALRRSDDEAAGFDRAGALQDVPVRLAGRVGEGCRDREK